MNDDLMTYLDSIDERLLGYLDEDEELPPNTVKRLHHYVVALADGSITPAHVMEDWPDFSRLAVTFVVAYGTEELEESSEHATVFGAAEETEDVVVGDADRRFLMLRSGELDRYPELRGP